MYKGGAAKMKIKKVLDTFADCIEEDAVIIIAGKFLCGVPNKFNDQSVLYLPEFSSALSVAIGSANATDKRVVLFCEDELLTKDFGSIIQAAASKCDNLYYVVLLNEKRRDSMTYSVAAALNSLKGAVFHLGFTVHNYTPHFEQGIAKKEIRVIWQKVYGPFMAFVDVDYQKANYDNVRALNLGSFRENNGNISSKE
jgi:hypothetical protein